MAEYVLKVQDIDDVGKDYVFDIRDGWLHDALRDTGLAPRDPSEASNPPEDCANPASSLRVHAHRVGSDIVVRAWVEATLVTECSRCLEPATIRVDAPFTALLSPRGEGYRPPPSELELTPEDLDRDFFVGDNLVLDGLVREQLLLEVPAKPLCAEDCAGISVPTPRGFGSRRTSGPSGSSNVADLNPTAEKDGQSAAGQASVDPRLAPLLKWVAKPTEE